MSSNASMAVARPFAAAMHMSPQPRFPIVTGLFTKLSRASETLTLQAAMIDTIATA